MTTDFKNGFQKRKTIASLAMNLAIVFMAIAGVTLSYYGIDFMKKDYTVRGATIFLLFTYQSNLLMLIPSALLVICDIRLLCGKASGIPNFVLVLKLAFTVGVAITFLVVLFFLAPINEHGFFASYANSNVFFHLLLPLFAIVSFVFFEPAESIKFFHLFASLAHTTAYMTVYTVFVSFHLVDGAPDPYYDFYGFFRPGLWMIPFNALIFLSFSFSLAFVLWRLNRIFAPR